MCNSRIRLQFAEIHFKNAVSRIDYFGGQFIWYPLVPQIVFKWLWPCIFTLQGFTLTLSRSHLSEPRIINNHIRFKKCPWNSKFSRVGIWNQKDQQVKWLELINQTYQQNKQWNNRSTCVQQMEWHDDPKIIFQKLLLVECKLFWWTVTYQHERWINSSYEALISECEYCSIHRHSIVTVVCVSYPG